MDSQTPAINHNHAAVSKQTDIFCHIYFLLKPHKTRVIETL